MTTWVWRPLGSFELIRSSCPLIPRWATSRSPPSSLITRYLPRRTTPVTFRPSSREAKALEFGWRRIDRSPLTSTDLTRLPTNSFSRSRLMVSTSGSSGTVRRLLSAGRFRLVHEGQFARQLLPGNPGRPLLRLLLRPSMAGPSFDPRHPDDRIEAFGVIRALVSYLVVRQGIESPGAQLLQAGLVVLPARAGRGFLDAVAEQSHDQVFG